MASMLLLVPQVAQRSAVPVDPQPYVRFVRGLPPAGEVSCAQRREAWLQQVRALRCEACSWVG